MIHRSDFNERQSFNDGSYEEFEQTQDKVNIMLWLIAVGALLLSLLALFGLIHTRSEVRIFNGVVNNIDREWQDLKDGDAIMAKVSFSFAGMTCVYVRGGHGANGGGDGGDGFICADGDKLKLYAVGGGQGGRQQ